MKIPRGAFIYFTLFLVLSVPFILAFLPQEFQATEFSIYNESWNGLSEFRDLFETYNGSGSGVTIKSLIGSTNALNRLNASSGADAGTLVIMGPKVRYDPTEAIAILLYVVKGGRVLIADDFGTGNDILNFFSILLEALSNTLADADSGVNPFGFETGSSEFGNVDTSGVGISDFPIVGIAINQSVLIDTGSFYRSPVQPLFSPPPASEQQGTTIITAAPWVAPMIENIDGNVIGNYAATISMKVKYPVEFNHSNYENINITEWSQLLDINQTASCDPQTGLDPGKQYGCQNDYTTSKNEVIWVPMGEFPVEITNILGIELPSAFKFSMKLSALYSSKESWLEANTTAAKNVEKINPDPSEWGNVEFPIAISFPLGFDETAGSITIISDPSIFINRYLKEERFEECGEEFTITTACEPDIKFDPTDYQNRQFANNLVKILVGDRPNSFVYFDEGHLAQSFTNPTLYLGTFFRFLDLMSMFPLLAPILPFSILTMARRYAPKGRRAGAPLLKTKVETFYGRSYFAYKMRWFLEYRHYTRGLELIYRRIRRDVTKRYDLQAWLPEIAVSALEREYPHLRKNMLNKLLEIESIVESGTMIEEEKFMDLYLSLKEIQDFIK